MEFVEKARIRLEHWIRHNEHHYQEYEMFVEQLEGVGETESAKHVMEMMELLSKGTDCLRRAIKRLK